MVANVVRSAREICSGVSVRSERDRVLSVTSQANLGAEMTLFSISFVTVPGTKDLRLARVFTASLSDRPMR